MWNFNEIVSRDVYSIKVLALAMIIWCVLLLFYHIFKKQQRKWNEITVSLNSIFAERNWGQDTPFFAMSIQRRRKLIIQSRDLKITHAFECESKLKPTCSISNSVLQGLCCKVECVKNVEIRYSTFRPIFEHRDEQ